MKKLSIIIPVYNEENTIIQVLDLVLKVKLPLTIKKEIIVVDDGSTDNTRSLVENYIKHRRNIKFLSKLNGGKGSAVRMGIKKSTGDIIIIQDADLELNPNEIPKIVDPILENNAEVVYGSRVLNKSNPHGFVFYFGGRFITFIANFLYGTKLTDEPCGFKAFKATVIKSIKIDSDGFEWEPEVLSKIARRKIKIHEVAVSCKLRSKKEGKKLKAKDGVLAAWILLRNRFKSLDLLMR